jgi:hypothetical protein
LVAGGKRELPTKGAEFINRSQKFGWHTREATPLGNKRTEAFHDPLTSIASISDRSDARSHMLGATIVPLGQMTSFGLIPFPQPQALGRFPSTAA